MTPEELALKGYYLFPCAGKTPLVKWPKRSTTDPVTIHRWKVRHPNCSWGIDCGKSGLFVIDDDRGKNPEAINSLFGLELEHGLLPETFTSKTQSGGYHYYYKGFGRNSAGNKLGPGLDTRGQGGFVVAPCSSGYAVEKDLPVAGVPEWVIDLVGRPPAKKERTDLENVILDLPVDIDRATSYLQTAEPAIEGNYGDTLTYKTACQVRDFGISEEKCLELMLPWNDTCSPPWDLEDLEVKVANAYEYAENSLGALSPDVVFAEFIEPAAPAEDDELFIDGTEFIAQSMKIDYLIRRLIETPSTGLIFGPSTVGKTFVSLDMALSIACGTSWLDGAAQQGIVVLFVGEGRQGLKRRIKAWLKHYGLTLPPNSLKISTKRIEFSRAGVMAAAAKLQSIHEKTGKPIRACFIDTLARHIPSGADENSAKDIGAFINAVDWLRDRFNCVAAVVHHTGKKNPEISRGSSALRGAMDWEFRVEGEGDIRSIVWTKQKEIRLPKPSSFRLEVVDLEEEKGEDEDEEDLDSVVPVICEYDPTRGKGKGLSDAVKKAFEILQLCIAVGPNENYADKKAWRDGLYKHMKDATTKAKEKAFLRARTDLTKAKCIEIIGDTVFDISLDGDMSVFEDEQ